MKKTLINRVYWAPDYSNAFSLGASGSQLTVNPDGTVHQHNDLMAPGDPIMFWRSHESYQFSKAVPQLPILQPGGKYRVVIHGSAFPTQTVTYRLNFIDSQGHEVKHLFFNEQEKVFTFPPDAINYEILIVNAGATDFYFRNLEISAAAAPEVANSDFWIQEPIGDQNQPRIILLIAAGKRCKENFPEIADYCAGYNVLPVVIGDLASPKISLYVKRLLEEPALKKARLVACDARFNPTISEIAHQFPDNAFMAVGKKGQPITADNVTTYWQRVRMPSIQDGVLRPDWPLIFTAINQNWGGYNG